ncbi:MAG: nuclear transport factor 2 family protein, partial [Candidatus Binatia bacterium]
MATPRGARTTKAVRKPMKAGKKPAQRAQRASRTAAARTVSARPTAANDHEGVRHVLTRYCHALDRGRLDEVGALFH